MAMAQTQTEQTISPTITSLTIQWACQNSVNSERSEEVSGSTDCATSAGFMRHVLWAVRAGLPARRQNVQTTRMSRERNGFPVKLGQMRAKGRERRAQSGRSWPSSPAKQR